MCPGDSVPPVLGSGGPPRNVFSPSQCSSLPGLTGAGGVWLVGCHPWPRAVFVALRLRAARAHATLATTCSVSRWEGVEPQVAPEQLRTQEGEARCPLFALSLPQSRKRALTGLAMGVFGRAPQPRRGQWASQGHWPPHRAVPAAQSPGAVLSGSHPGPGQCRHKAPEQTCPSSCKFV